MKNRSGLNISFTDEVPHAVKSEQDTTKRTDVIPTPQTVKEVFKAKCPSSTARILQFYYKVGEEYQKPKNNHCDPFSLDNIDPEVVQEVLSHLKHGTQLNPKSEPIEAAQPHEITIGMSPGK